MLNAEDTKERIRKLRLKVVSGPTDPITEDSLKDSIAESTKNIKEWKNTLGPDNVGQTIVENNNHFKKNVEKVLGSVSPENLNKFQDQNTAQDLNNNMFSQSTIQNEIDKRVKNNAKLIIELFNDRIEDLKSKIINIDKLEDFRIHIAEQLEISITSITEIINEKVSEILQHTDLKDKELDNLINEKSSKLVNITENKINIFTERLNAFDNEFPQVLKKLEDKIYSDINHLVDDFRSKIKVETDKVSLTNEMFKNDFTKITENFEELDRKTEEKLDILSIDINTEKSENENQFNLVTDSHNDLKRDLDDLKDSVGLKSDALASEFSFQIDDLNTEFSKKLNFFDQELENIINNFNAENKLIKSKLDIKFENLQETVSSIASQIHNDNKQLKSDVDQRINILENDSIKQMDYLEKELKKNLDTNDEAISTIKFSLEKKIDENNKQSLETINLVDKNIREKLDISNKELETNNKSLYQELKDDIKKTKIQSDDLFKNTNSSINEIKKEIEDSQKILLTEIVKKNNDVEESFRKKLDEKNKKLINSFVELKTAYDLKIQNYSNSFDAKILQNNEFNQQNIDKLNQSISEMKSSTEYNYSELSKSLSDVNDVITNYKKEITDNQKVLEIKFSQEQKNVLGLFKDKYKTLKSQIWEEFSIIRNADKKNLEKVNQIEKKMVTLPTLQKNIKDQLINENNKLNFKLKNEIHKINNLIKSLDNRILNEKELIEIFQNHTLNVNITQNKKLLSKVKKEYENQKSDHPKKNKLTKIVSTVILAISLGSILMILK